MAKVEFLVPIILRWEGGYVNHPNDKGGPTNKGITIATYRTYKKLKGEKEPFVQDLKNISDVEWMDILKTLYWDKWKADMIENQPIANLVVDWYWGSGKYGIIFPQRILGVTDDGIVGKITLSAINSYQNQEELFYLLWNRRKKHFEDIVKQNPSQNVFLKGWLNRLNSFTYK